MTTELRTPRPLNRLEITGLHGNRDISLTLKENKRILIDENGSGKTTVLSILFYLLGKKIEKLRRFAFDKIILTFAGDAKVEFTREELLGSPQNLQTGSTIIRNRVSRIMNTYSEDALHYLIKLAHRPIGMFAEAEIVRDISATTNISLAALHETARTLAANTADPERTIQTDAKLKQLAQLFPHHVLYFPTYRRVEEDLNLLGRIEKELPRSEELIQFGMADVKNKLDSITAEIRAKSVEWYSIVNGQMISQLVDGINVTDEMRQTVNTTPTLRIVLDRIGKNITTSKKDDILKLVASGQIGHARYDTLIYFLANLMKIYEKQQDRDNDIKEFARTINGYLRDKEVRYNESMLSITVAQKETGEDVQLESLSSGEKQIVSTFSKLYFSESKSLAILFDEPELSLSMEWQQKLLQDITQSGRCAALIAATHSPFIFQNALDGYASQLTIRPRAFNVSN